ncbi:N-(5'-phosphoribosyl)anthranilate isomerase [Sulfitobacter aestuarii]|uniref:N-(5'-phosphoribosyl)anthranilate isomerase n=1 Tax=Sulfitobacter aestuarii TaxID=2161676 RepID=A0ABW5U6Y4_9RHOB
MKHAPSPLSPQAWITTMFSSRAACSGGVIRRNLRDIERYVGIAAFEAELRRRGFHAMENAGQLVIFCNQEPIRFVL